MGGWGVAIAPLAPFRPHYTYEKLWPRTERVHIDLCCKRISQVYICQILWIVSKDNILLNSQFIPGKISLCKQKDTHGRPTYVPCKRRSLNAMLSVSDSLRRRDPLW